MLNICSGTQAWNIEDFVKCGATLVYTLYVSLRERGKQFPTLGVEAVEASSLSKFCPHFIKVGRKKLFNHNTYKLGYDYFCSIIKLGASIDWLGPTLAAARINSSLPTWVTSPSVCSANWQIVFNIVHREKKNCSIIVVSCIHNTKVGQQHTLEKYITPFWNSGL